VFHLIDGLVVLVLRQFHKTPILVHARVQEVLVDRYQFVAENAIEMFNDFWVAFQNVAPDSVIGFRKGIA
jgi:hypothetical protein